jgi:hypothetical protein
MRADVRRTLRWLGHAIAVLAVEAKPRRGRFASLDGAARRWRREGAEAKRRSGAAA